jgi:hypothetical protein
MSNFQELNELIITRTLFIPVSRDQLFNTIFTQLDKIFPSININGWWFNQNAWDGYDKGSHMSFMILPEYFYIRSKSKPTTKLFEYEKWQKEYKKDPDKIAKKLPKLLDNSYPLVIHVIVLGATEKGCEIEIEYTPFLYLNIFLFKTKVEGTVKQHSMHSFERYVKHFEVGLNAQEINRTDLTKYTQFLGINDNWMVCTCALQLQEVAVTIVAKKVGIELTKKNVTQIVKDSPPSDPAFKKKYEAFSTEVRGKYGIEMPRLITSLRDIREEVLHRGYNPNDAEKESIVIFTNSLLEKLKNVCDISNC